MKRELLDWLASSELNVFATVSLKQAIENDEAGWSRITPAHTTKTAWLLRDRVTKALVGKKHRIPFLVFAEGDGFIKRKHLHIATARPHDISIDRFTDVLRFQASKLDWVHKEIDIRAVEDKTHRQVIAYSLKEGTDAFIPEASFVPFMN